MKLIIDQSPEIGETEITIRCSIVTPELKAIIERIRMIELTLSGMQNGKWYQIPIENIYYIDSVDGRTFLYCADKCYECKSKLYELEEQLCNMSFLRISKNNIVNLRSLKSVRPLDLSRMQLLLHNGEKLVVTRHYLIAFKKRFGI